MLLLPHSGCIVRSVTTFHLLYNIILLQTGSTLIFIRDLKGKYITLILVYFAQITAHGLIQDTLNEWNRLPGDCVNATSVNNVLQNKIDKYFKRSGYAYHIYKEHNCIQQDTR